MTAPLDALVEKARLKANEYRTNEDYCTWEMMRAALLAIGVDKMVEALEKIQAPFNTIDEDRELARIALKLATGD